ncbi:hypothetical protein G3580_17555 [Nitrogeniibacter mangrovi]|uniref:Uncharacterized protein n=1 Tax=Nitrogeniibacter mangrovi TaxID=2016596 RepID=A0A6C1B8V8_9RHOO|nr:hypothetical protein [Nitrogeniibacter mangrovi]QID19265.1 hypothetical protein G3580_17555 [Nitrogeniibacter mangrovi]
MNARTKLALDAPDGVARVAHGGDAGCDLEALVCDSVSMVSAQPADHVFVIEPPSRPVTVVGNGDTLRPLIAAALGALVGLEPGGATIHLWTVVRPIGARDWGAIRMRQSRADGGWTWELAHSVVAEVFASIEAAGAKVELAVDAGGAVALTVWLPLMAGTTPDASDRGRRS